MLLIRLVLLLAIAGGLSLFALSNLQPLSLTFLGIQTPALPLAIWVLGAIAAGIVTNLLLNVLFSLSNYFATRNVRSRTRQTSRRTGSRTSAAPSSEPATSYTQSKDDDTAWRDWEGYEEPVDRTAATASASAQATDDDWESDLDDDWESYQPVDTPRQATQDRSDYEANQKPKATSRSGSVYSYSYQEPGSTGVGKTEPVLEKPVVDAEYRVIVPPYQAPETYNPPVPADAETEEESADDWFEEDDEFEDKDDRQRPLR